MDIKYVYKRKHALEKRIYNMIRRFENDCNITVGSIEFFNPTENGDINENYEIHLNTELWNDKSKVES